MTKTEIEEYLLKLEHQLLIGAKKIPVELTREWARQFPSESGVYLFREDGEICYIGETGDLKGRMTDVLSTLNHSLRRNLGNFHFPHLENHEKASSRKKFPDEIEVLLNERFERNLTVSVIPVVLGRKELEERLYDKFQPKYNQKGNRSQKKAYTKVEKQLENSKAYEPWTAEDDKKLEVLFCEGKQIIELSKIFERNEGVIRSRINKLELKEKYGS